MKHPEAQEALREYIQLPMGTPVKKGRMPPKMLLLILDELDCLRSQDCTILYNLFSFTQGPSSRLVLIGISNSIDILERRLPRLREMGCPPHAIPFSSYSADQIGDILRHRLSSLPGPVFQEPALKYCGRKIASHSGDMRQALQTCSVALMNLAAEHSKETESASTGGISSREVPSIRGRRLVGIGDMAKAISTLRGGSGEASAIVQAMRALPQQQQLVLCAASKLLGQIERASIPEVTKGPSTPQSSSKVPRPRMASFMSPGAQQNGSTPTGKASRTGTPQATNTPGSVQYARLSVLGTAQECSMGVLHESYSQLCKQVSMKPLNSLEFAASCSNLVDMGIMAMGNAREERMRKISLKAHKDDVVLALQDVRMLRNLLSL